MSRRLAISGIVVGALGCTHAGIVSSRQCGDSTAPRIVRLTQSEVWSRTAVGRDTVFAEHGVAAASIERAGKRIQASRQMLEDLTGRSAPPISVVLLEHRPNNIDVYPDGTGHIAWPYSADADLHGLVHEWTHSLVHDALRARMDARARYLEDGLCDLLEELVERQIASTAPTRAESSLKRLVAQCDAGARGAHDLFDLSSEYDARSEQARDDQCKRDPVLGYTLGLAYWLDHLERQPLLVPQFFRSLHDIGGNAEQIANWIERASPGGLSARSIEVCEAARVIRNHLSPAHSVGPAQ